MVSEWKSERERMAKKENGRGRERNNKVSQIKMLKSLLEKNHYNEFIL